MHIDLPKNEWYEKPGLFGDTLIVKSKSYKFTFNEYMQNTIPIAPRLSRDKLIPRINERARGIHYAYQLIPKYIFSDEYMSEMDTKIQTMITQNDTDLISAYITDKLYLDMVDSNRDFYNIMDKMLEKTYDYNNDELIEDY